ncbi:MAG TPA: nucleotidyltransferase [Blastocatellia bacterium]|nr:nucleotidyltransferase [Blastocatellia bacterium]
MRELERQLILLAQYNVEFVIIGGVAATLHGSSYLTQDLDICYARDLPNFERLASALQSVNARLRGVPEDVPFLLDAETLRRGLNFTFQTDIGAMDLLGEVVGVGGFAEATASAVEYELFGYRYRVLALDKLIAAKRAAGRPKDLLALPELEAILEHQRTHESPDGPDVE